MKQAQRTWSKRNFSNESFKSTKGLNLFCRMEHKRVTIIRGPHPFEIFNFGLGVVGGAVEGAVEAVGGAVDAVGVVGGAIGWPSCFLSLNHNKIIQLN